MFYHFGTWGGFPKIRFILPTNPNIYHDGSGSKQVDPLKTLYKRDLTPLA